MTEKRRTQVQGIIANLRLIMQELGDLETEEERDERENRRKRTLLDALCTPAEALGAAYDALGEIVDDLDENFR